MCYNKRTRQVSPDYLFCVSKESPWTSDGNSQYVLRYIHVCGHRYR